MLTAINRAIITTAFLLSISGVLWSQKCHFMPPSKWKITPLSQNASKYVKAGFVGKAKNNIRPSITLSTEEIDVSAEEYLNIVKNLYQEERSKVWDLGTIDTQSGKAFLLKITSSKQTNQLETLQMIFAKGGYAYILTGALPKKEYYSQVPLLRKSFESFQLIDNYANLLTDASKKKSLRKLLEGIISLKTLREKKQKKEIVKITKDLERKFPELGPYSILELIKEVLTSSDVNMTLK